MSQCRPHLPPDLYDEVARLVDAGAASTISKLVQRYVREGLARDADVQCKIHGRVVRTTAEYQTLQTSERD